MIYIYVIWNSGEISWNLYHAKKLTLNLNIEIEMLQIITLIQLWTLIDETKARQACFNFFEKLLHF